MNKDLILKKGDIVTYIVNETNEDNSLLIDGYDGATLEDFEEEGVKIIKVERPVKYKTIYETVEKITTLQNNNEEMKCNMNNKVYLVVRQWKDFEDYDCNGTQVDCVCDSKCSVINKCLNSIYEELQCNMEFLEQKDGISYNSLTFKEVIDELAKNKVISLKQKEGNGVTTIYIVEKEVLK